MSRPLRSRNKINPEFDPSELADLLHTPAVGSGVSSHLLERPKEPTVVAHNMTTVANMQAAGNPSASQAANLTTVDDNNKTTVVPISTPLIRNELHSDQLDMTTVADSRMGTVVELTTDPAPYSTTAADTATVVELRRASLWFTEDGSPIPPAKVRRIQRAQDALSAAEESVYNLLWNHKQGREESFKLAQAGYDVIMKRTKFSKKTVQRIVDKLIDKEFIAIEIPADIYHRTSTTYRVFSYRAILDRQAARGRLHVAKVGPGVVYAHQATHNMTTVAISTRSTVVNLSPVTVANSPPVTVAREYLSTVVPQTTIIREEQREQLQSAAAFSEIVQKLRQFGPADDDAGRYLVRVCRTADPAASEDEILHFLGEKGALVERQRARILNPVGFLLAAVPRCFQGDTLRIYREEMTRARELERRKQAEAEAELASMRQHHESILADPAAHPEDRRLARKILGLDPWASDVQI